MMSGGKDKLKSMMEKMQGKAQAKAGGGGAMGDWVETFLGTVLV